MTEDNPMPDEQASPEPPRFRVRHRLPWVLALAVGGPLLLLMLYTGLALHWSYSNGARAGILQKFSRKGWICKTWEGELAMTTVPGVAPTLWSFTVREAHAAEQVAGLLGRRVMLHYTEHRGVPTSCFGETGYFVDSVSVIP